MIPHYVMGAVILVLVLLAILSAIASMYYASKATHEVRLKTKKPIKLVLVNKKKRQEVDHHLV